MLVSSPILTSSPSLPSDPIHVLPTSSANLTLRLMATSILTLILTLILTPG
jgi:hypothetical protein